MALLEARSRGAGLLPCAEQRVAMPPSCPPIAWKPGNLLSSKRHRAGPAYRRSHRLAAGSIDAEDSFLRLAPASAAAAPVGRDEAAQAQQQVQQEERQAESAAGVEGRDAEEADAEQPPYVPLDFAPAATVTAEPFDIPGDKAPLPAGPRQEPDAGTLWGLLVLSLAYLHHSTTGFALPALLPLITEDMKLQDNQGALLTAGYTVLYAIALVPTGLLADRVDRPRLLAVGITLWSGLTVLASNARGFGELLACRVGFAAAQATQNPICFSLIPELFPSGRTTAMAVYNSAIYAGRALSFAALILAGQLGVPEGLIGTSVDLGYTLVPLDKVDLSLVSILYMQGDYAAVTPVYSYVTEGAVGGVPIESAFSAWRQLLMWLGPPGLVIAGLCLLTLDEPRAGGTGFLGNPLKSSRFLVNANSGGGGDGSSAAADGGGGGGGAALALAGPASVALAAPAAAAAAQPAGDSLQQSMDKLRVLLRSPAFLSLTAAAAFNDVGSWALVGWQATFYQRVYHLSPDVYAPLLAVVIPVGGLIGGVGAGLFGDWLNRIGARGLITAGANMAAAPAIAISLLAPDYKQSFAALLVGFALSEAWRAPAAVAVRDVSPPGLGSTGSAVHLCIRNLVGGLGPVAVAVLSSKVGLQLAMLLVPTCYLLSGIGFVITEAVLAAEAKEPRRTV